MSQSPQWPDQPDQSPSSDAPLSHLARLARSRRGLTAITVVTSVLILALLGTLALALSSNAQGATAQTRQHGLNGQATDAGAAQATTADDGGGGTSSSGGTPTGDGGGKHSTPTPSHGSVTPTPTSGSIIGCCLTFGPSVHQVVSQVMLSGTSAGPVVATCPSGEIALSGGWAVAYNSGATIFRSERTGSGSWGVYVRHSSSVGVTTYAECLANATGATIAERATYASVSPGDVGTPAVSCAAGEVLVGGGFALATGLDLYSFGAQSSASQWRSYALNRGSSSANMNIYAECLTYAKAHSSQTAYVKSSVAVGARGGTTSIACPSGAYVSGGIFLYNTDADLDATAFVYATWASGSNTNWAADLYANGGGDATIGSQAVCLGF